MKKRIYKKARLLDSKKVGRVFFTLFILFVGYKILTPTSIELARLDSPNGERTARLRKLYYTSEPSYKIYARERDKLVWMNLFDLSSYTNTPSQTTTEELSWSTNSQKLFFKINNQLIWQYTFENN